MTNIMQRNDDRLFGHDCTSSCEVHGPKCKIYQSTSGIQRCGMKMGWAGTSCLDVCRTGKRAGRYGPMNKPFKVWAWERRKSQEELYFQESTEDFDAQSIIDELGDLFHVHNMRFGPENLGWWTRRLALRWLWG